MNNTYLIFEYEKFTLWEFPEKFNYTDDPSKPLPEDSPDNDKAKRIIETCDSLERFLIPIAEPSSIFRRVYNFLFDHTLGYSDYMRVELELRYGGENVCITSKDGTLLDAMYLKADSEEDQDYDSPTASELGPIVIICNPNAGYYEYAIEMHDHWIEFYRTNGINILLWNYRGYGRSKGHPTPENILADGEAVLQYLKDIKGSGRIILHGESLGGSVAAHIAAKLGCDLLFTDRTFSDLDAIAEFSVGPVAAAIMKQATGWHLETTNSFLAAQCYKVLSSDPNDAVVGEVASLKNGISKQVSLENRINGRLALTENEAYVFYRNLSDLYGMVRDFHATSRRRAKKKRRQDRPKSQDITASSGARVHTSSDGELEMSLSSMESQPPIEVSASVCINSARDAKPHIEFKVPTKYEKFMRKGDFEEYNVVVHLLNKIYSELEKVDAAGSTIGKIMKERREYRLKLLKGFLMNLDIWGSHPPARIESIYQPLPTLMEARMRSYSKVKTLRINLKAIIMEYQHSDSLMIKKLIGNLEMVTHYLHQIEQFLDLRQKHEIMDLSGEVKLEMSENAGVMSSPREFLRQEPEYGSGKVETEARVMETSIKELPGEETIGYILPLNCGHNGSLSLAELNLFQKHLINAQIVALAESPEHGTEQYKY